MTKIERIKEIVGQYGLSEPDLTNDDCFGAFVTIEALRAMRDLADAYIHAEARARKLKHKFAECEYGNCPLERDGYDWIAAVKKEVGWVEDQMAWRWRKSHEQD